MGWLGIHITDIHGTYIAITIYFPVGFIRLPYLQIQEILMLIKIFSVLFSDLSPNAMPISHCQCQWMIQPFAEKHQHEW